MKRRIILAIGILGAAAVLWGVSFYWQNFRGVGPAVKPPPEDITELIGEDTTELPLTLPAGFSISVFAKDLPGARVMAFDAFGNMWVSQTDKGIVSLIEVDKESGRVHSQGEIMKDLRGPHGLAFDPVAPFSLLIAEEHRIIRIPTYSELDIQEVAELPSGGRHATRTLGFGPDGRLYVSVGSTCDVCHEKDQRNAAILTVEKDGVLLPFARGLRNSVFFTWRPGTREIWATEMGRDMLGDDLPPDEVNIVRENGNYGWPICYGKNVHDTEFDKNTYIRNPCMEPFETLSHIDFPAHSAPLGLAFVPATSTWPKAYRGDLFVAFHGSWNRSVPTGYKIVRVDLDADGSSRGMEDFITGWLTPEGALGRPVDLKFGPDGALYISDDKAGVIYRVTPPRP